MTDRVVLACSGGGGASVALPFLTGKTGAEVVADAVDAGRGGADPGVIRTRAQEPGAVATGRRSAASPVDPASYDTGTPATGSSPRTSPHGSARRPRSRPLAMPGSADRTRHRALVRVARAATARPVKGAVSIALRSPVNNGRGAGERWE